ncbi:MAG: AAA family ATPase [Spirochaetes bacterium]|nr:AAA family ATPase [Spirochaetota bacterium]
MSYKYGLTQIEYQIEISKIIPTLSELYDVSAWDAADYNNRADFLLKQEMNNKRQPIEEILTPMLTSSQIVGLEEAKEIINRDIRLRASTETKQKLILLEGPSGVAKTTLIEAIIKENILKYPDIFEFYRVDTTTLTVHVTTTAKLIKEFFNEMRLNKKKIILFIDEADECLRSRLNAGAIATERTSNIMKQLNIEIPNLYIICATNRPKMIDRAILERFQSRVNCPIPTKEELRKIIDLHMPFLKEDYKHSIHNYLTNSSYNWSGRDIYTLSNTFSEIIQLNRLDEPNYVITPEVISLEVERKSNSKKHLKDDYLED